MKRFLMILLISLLATSGLYLGSAMAKYPEKPVTFVNPWPPGGMEDVLVRMIADEFQTLYDVPTAVVNKPGKGAGPFPGAMTVGKAPADGYMIGNFVIAVPVIGPNIGMPGLTAETFEPVGIYMTYPFVLATTKDAPYNNLQELATYAKTHDVALAHFGMALIPTRITFAATKKLGFSFGSESAYDTIDCNTFSSGDADVATASYHLWRSCLNKVKFLATFTDDRMPVIPNVKTMAEVQPELGLSLWNGLFVKSGTPESIKKKITAAALVAIHSAKAKKLAKDTGVMIYWRDAEDAKKKIAKDKMTFKEIVNLLK